MGYSNGQLESEVKGGKGEKGDPVLPGIGFKLTDDGNFEIDEKRLTDLRDPIDDGDATTKKYVDQNKSNKNDVILRDGSQNNNNNNKNIFIQDNHISYKKLLSTWVLRKIK